MPVKDEVISIRRSSSARHGCVSTVSGLLLMPVTDVCHPYRAGYLCMSQMCVIRIELVICARHG